MHTLTDLPQYCQALAEWQCDFWLGLAGLWFNWAQAPHFQFSAKGERRSVPGGRPLWKPAPHCWEPCQQKIQQIVASFWFEFGRES